MLRVANNDLSRVVNILNFEYENMSRAVVLLREVYKVPQRILPLVVHTVFQRLGDNDGSDRTTPSLSFWDQFHYLALDETRRLGLQN